MTATHTPPKPTELAEEASDWAVGAGIITLALFPLALPALALIGVLAIPLLVPALVVGLLVAVIVVPIRLARRLSRRAGRAAEKAKTRQDQARLTRQTPSSALLRQEGSRSA